MDDVTVRHEQPGSREEEEEEEKEKETPRASVLWRVFGRRAPRSEIVFGCQMVIILIVVCTSIYNLTVAQGESNLWTALLSSCLGYILPSPTLGLKKQNS